MRHRLATFLLAINAMGLVPLFGDESAKKPAEMVHTERVNFAPGGVIRVLHSFGSISVEGWDRPEVEFTVIRSREGHYEPKQSERAMRSFERIRITAEHGSESELTISTRFPRKLIARLLGAKGGNTVEYKIHAPRDSRLVIHHGSGSILVSNITGDVEAASSSGDILLMLPDSGTYSIDAKSKLGTVSSDFEGSSHRRHIVGSGFAAAIPPPSHRIYLRIGIGGITIKAIPVEERR